MYYSTRDCVKQKERKLPLGLTGTDSNWSKNSDTRVWIPETRARQRFEIGVAVAIPF